MYKVLGLAVLVMGMATALFAGATSPEIDASTGVAAVALLSGGIRSFALAAASSSLAGGLSSVTRNFEFILASGGLPCRLLTRVHPSIPPRRSGVHFSESACIPAVCFRTLSLTFLFAVELVVISVFLDGAALNRAGVLPGLIRDWGPWVLRGIVGGAAIFATFLGLKHPARARPDLRGTGTGADHVASAGFARLVDEADRPAPQLGKFPPDDTWRPAEPGPDPLPVDYPRGAALMMRRFFFTAIRQIDERYGQFGSDADLCFQLRRAGKKILLVPPARARHQGRATESDLRKADCKQGAAAWIGKYSGFWSGLRAQIGAVFGALGSLQLTVLKYLLAGQKVDGSQQE